MTGGVGQKWDAIYSARNTAGRPAAAAVLQRQRHLLPSQGRALDYACGLGGNALLFSEAGLESHAWDVSCVAIQALGERGSSINTEVRDLATAPLPPASFDVIAVSYYLDRAQLPTLCHALRPGGLLFYETYNHDRAAGTGPSNPDFLLQQGELLHCFQSLQVLFYEELWGVAAADGESGLSRFVARQAGL